MERRTVFVVAAGACAPLLACAAVLGIGDLPGPAGGQALDAASDAPDALTAEGGDASAGATPIAQNQPGPVAIALDDTRVYWVNATSGTVVYCPKSGCTGAPQAVTSFTTDGNTNPFRYNITVDRANVYWIASGAVGSTETVMQCAIAGCNNAPTVLMSVSTAAGIGVGPSSVFAATKGSSGDGGAPGSGIVECAIGGCNKQPTLFAAEPTVRSVAVHEGRVYWTAADIVGQKDILSCPVTGCAGAPQVLLTGPFPLLGNVAVGNGNVYAQYAIAADQYGVLSCAIGGCASAPTPLVTGLRGSPGDAPIAVNATDVYWGTLSTTPPSRTSVSGCAIGGCAEPRAVLPPHVDDFAVDDTSIYWVDTAGGRVFRAPK